MQICLYSNTIEVNGIEKCALFAVRLQELGLKENTANEECYQ